LGFGLLAFIVLHHVGKTASSSCANRVEGKPPEKSLALCDRAASENWYTASLAVPIRPDVRYGSKADINGMSALCPLYPPHADIRSALTHVPKGQKQTFLVLENVTLQKASTAPQPGAVNSTCA
jgi:hypothetical protein